jgi:hypothetical protein
MKFRYLLIALCIAGIPGMAQVSPGIKIGGNISDLHSDGSASHSKVGLHLGGLAHIHLSDRFALQPEVVYSRQGAKSKASGDDISVHLDYLNIPVLFQYMFANGFRIQTGPQLGFMLSAKAESGNETQNVKDGYNSIDLSLPIGVGIITDSGFGVDARYVLGLSNVSENDNNKVTNRVLQLGVFYQFGQR